MGVLWWKIGWGVVIWEAAFDSLVKLTYLFAFSAGNLMIHGDWSTLALALL
jgi:hypothetical protein